MANKAKSSPPKAKKIRSAASRHPKYSEPVFRPSGSRILCLIGLLGCTYFGSQLATMQVSPPIPAPQITHTKNESSSKPVSLPASEPTRLKIADINVDTELIALGLNADGTMAVPTSYDIAGYYKNGPLPGEVGPAIIVGHVSHRSGSAVFWRLGELKNNRIIEVSRMNGTVAKFKVDRVQIFKQDNFPEQEIYGPADYAGLRIITCGGTFNRVTQRYSHNTVVFASLVRE